MEEYISAFGKTVIWGGQTILGEPTFGLRIEALCIPVGGV